jgi:heptosyltransferase II
VKPTGRCHTPQSGAWRLNKKIVNAQAEKILLRVPNWVGDALLTTPVVYSIKKAFPDSRITILAKPWVAPIFEANPAVEDVILYQKPGRHQGIRGKAALARELKARGYNLVINFPHSFESALISYEGSIPVRIGYSTEGRGLLLTDRLKATRDRKKEHQVPYFFHLLEPLNIFETPSPESHPLRLSLSQTHREKAETLLKNLGITPSDFLVALAPGAIYGSAKCWPFDRYEALARRMKQEWKAQVLLFGTDKDALAGRNTDPRYYHDLMGKTSLSEALALISKCSLMVCNDSGLMHAASALNIPMVALFGSTDAQRTGPWGGIHKIIDKYLPCAPCLKKKCAITPNCMEAIALDEVWEGLSDLRSQVGI